MTAPAMDGDFEPQLRYSMNRWNNRTPSPEFAREAIEPISPIDPTTSGPAMRDATSPSWTADYDRLPQVSYHYANVSSSTPGYQQHPIDYSHPPSLVQRTSDIHTSYERAPADAETAPIKLDPLSALADFALSTAPADYHQRSRSPVAQPATPQQTVSPTFTKASPIATTAYPPAPIPSLYGGTGAPYPLPSFAPLDELPPLRGTSFGSPTNTATSVSPSQPFSLPSVNGLASLQPPSFPDSGRSKRHKVEEADVVSRRQSDPLRDDRPVLNTVDRRASASATQTNDQLPRSRFHYASRKRSLDSLASGSAVDLGMSMPANRSARLPTPPLPEPATNAKMRWGTHGASDTTSDGISARPSHPWINTSPIDEYATLAPQGDRYDEHSITVKRPEDRPHTFTNGEAQQEAAETEVIESNAPVNSASMHSNLPPEAGNSVKPDVVVPVGSLPTPTRDEESLSNGITAVRNSPIQRGFRDDTQHANLTPEEQNVPMQTDKLSDDVDNMRQDEATYNMDFSNSDDVAPVQQQDVEMTEDGVPEPTIEHQLIGNNSILNHDKVYEAAVYTKPEIDEGLGTTADELPIVDADGDVSMDLVPNEPSVLPQPPFSGTVSENVPRRESEEYCQTCKVPYNQVENEAQENHGSWIECDGCKGWHHGHCVGLDQETMDKLDKFYCQTCQVKYGPSTMKRTSGRSTIAIDYNALHNGSSIPIKNPVDAKVHPYVPMISENRPEEFHAQNVEFLTPEMVTTEHLDRSAWTAPFIVPAKTNVAPWHLKKDVESIPPVEQRAVGAEEHLASITPHASTPPPPPSKSRGSPQSSNSTKTKQSRRSTPEKPNSNGYNIETSQDRTGADGLDMIIPADLTVRRVAELIGEGRPVEMINVLSQTSTSADRWSIEQLAEYYENPEKNAIMNCISCEVTNTPLGNMISRPKIVREMDLVERVWDRAKDPKAPTVGKYVLMSVRNSYTDWHIDFAGSSVFYHIYDGEKVFLIYPPTEKNLEAYEKWSLLQEMNSIWLPTLMEDKPMRVTLKKGDTMFIPSGWIHAVWTPVDSLVIGGNFLTRNHYTMQLRIQDIEVRTGVKLSQRYPRFTTLMWYCVYKYLKTDPLPADIDESLAQGKIITSRNRPSEKCQYTKHELEGLSTLCAWLYRVAMICLGMVKVTQKSFEALKKTVPEEFRSDILGNMKLFARWCIYKRAYYRVLPEGEKVPDWATADWEPSLPLPPAAKKAKKPTEEESRRLSEPRRVGLRDRNKSVTPPGPSAPISTLETQQSSHAPKPPPTRPSAAPSNVQRKKKPESSKPQSSTADKVPQNLGVDEEGERFQLSDGSIYVRKLSNLGPPRAGCQNCRQKKTGCKHKDEIAKILAGHGQPAPAPKPKSTKSKAKDESGPSRQKSKADSSRINAAPAPQKQSVKSSVVKANEPDRMDVDHDPPLNQNNGIDHSSPPKNMPSSPPKAPIKALVSQKPVPAPQGPSVASEMTNGDGTNGPPPGFKGRKPSCPECKALKKKCPHNDTWTLLTEKQAVKDSKKAMVQHNNVHRRQKKVEARRKQSPPSGNALVPTEEEGHSIVVNGASLYGTAAAASTASTAPVADMQPAQPPVSSSPKAPRVKESSPPLDLPVLDTSILNDAPDYDSRVATTTPEDPSIMAPPIADYDEHGVQPRPSSSAGGSEVLKDGPKSPVGQPTARTKKSKITYTSTTKTIKRKAGDDGGNANKAPKASPRSSPGSARTTDAARVADAAARAVTDAARAVDTDTDMALSSELIHQIQHGLRVRRPSTRA